MSPRLRTTRGSLRSTWARCVAPAASMARLPWPQAICPSLNAASSRLTLSMADQVGRSSVLVLHYRRAVYSAVQAELVEEYRDMDTTGKGDKNADAMEPRADTHRRNMRWALSDLLGQPRTTVELI